MKLLSLGGGTELRERGSLRRGVEGAQKVGRGAKNTVNAVRATLQTSRMAIRAAEAILIATLFYKLPEAKDGVDLIKSFPLEYLNFIIDYTDLIVEEGWDLITGDSPLNGGVKSAINTMKNISVNGSDIGKLVVSGASLEISRKILSGATMASRVLYPPGNIIDKKVPEMAKKVLM